MCNKEFYKFKFCSKNTKVQVYSILYYITQIYVYSLNVCYLRFNILNISNGTHS